jgi:hypothetical protein
VQDQVGNSDDDIDVADVRHEQWFYYYFSGMIFLSLLIYTSMRDTKQKSAMHRHV